MQDKQITSFVIVANFCRVVSGRKMKGSRGQWSNITVHVFCLHRTLWLLTRNFHIHSITTPPFLFFRKQAVAFTSFVLLVPIGIVESQTCWKRQFSFLSRNLVVMRMFLDVMVKKFLRVITCTAGYLPSRQKWPGTDAIFNRRDSLISCIFLLI